MSPLSQVLRLVHVGTLEAPFREQHSDQSEKKYNKMTMKDGNDSLSGILLVYSGFNVHLTMRLYLLRTAACVF
jgi:hypothetical protein